MNSFYSTKQIKVKIYAKEKSKQSTQSKCFIAWLCGLSIKCRKQMHILTKFIEELSKFGKKKL